MLQLGELQLQERCMFLWARMIRKIGDTVAWLFSGSYDLFTEVVIRHHVRQVDEILLLCYGR